MKRELRFQKEAREREEQRTSIGCYADLMGGPEAVERANLNFPVLRIVEEVEQSVALGESFDAAKARVYELLAQVVTTRGEQRTRDGLQLVQRARDRLDLRGHRHKYFEPRCRLTGIIADLEGFLE